MFSSFIFNEGTISNAENNMENNDIVIALNDVSSLEQRLTDMQREMYIKNLIQYVEFESEIIIPKYIDVKYIEYTYNLANEFGFSSRIIFRLIYKESTFRDTVVSDAGAKGLMQLMPDTRKHYYKDLRVDTLNLDKNQEDIYIGMNYLKDMQKYWVKRGNSEKYSLKLALASYNAGEGKVHKYQGIPPYKETTDFINFILKAHSNPQFFANYSKKYGDEIKNRS
jgi:soluble lytic murein transglycosylase-like protein